jgi:NADPH:quinone reductase-like Zn-dependent oxidoreductase
MGLRRPNVTVRGRDLAGVVTAIGSGVTRFRPGDEVYGTTLRGSYAEYTTTAEQRLARKPANLTFTQAAAVPVSGMTALQAVRDSGGVRAGQRVLVIGAGGGIGSFAVQLAKAAGAHVTGVCSTSKAELVRTIGADDVIDYTRADFADGSRTFDVVIDTAGRRPLSRLRRALTSDGVLVLVGGEGGDRWLGGFQRQMLAPVRSIGRKQKLIGLVYRETRDLLLALTELVEGGKVTPVVSRTYPLSEAAEAIEALEGGHTAGKLVLTVP